MNRGIDQGNDLPNDLLEKIFASIEANPFKLPEDEDGQATAFFNPERDGWLMKEGGKAKNWKKRWFSLVNNCLYYFEKPDDHKPKGTIPLENLFVREIPDSKRANCFEIIAEEGSTVKGAKMDSKGRMVQGGTSHVVVRTTSGAFLHNPNPEILHHNAYLPALSAPASATAVHLSELDCIGIVASFWFQVDTRRTGSRPRTGLRWRSG